MRNHLLPTTFLKINSAVYYGILQMMLKMQKIGQASVMSWATLLNEKNKVDDVEVEI